MKRGTRGALLWVMILTVMVAGLAATFLGGRVLIAAILSDHPIWP